VGALSTKRFAGSRCWPMSRFFVPWPPIPLQVRCIPDYRYHPAPQSDFSLPGVEVEYFEYQSSRISAARSMEEFAVSI